MDTYTRAMFYTPGELEAAMTLLFKAETCQSYDDWEAQFDCDNGCPENFRKHGYYSRNEALLSRAYQYLCQQDAVTNSTALERAHDVSPVQQTEVNASTLDSGTRKGESLPYPEQNKVPENPTLRSLFEEWAEVRKGSIAPRTLEDNYKPGIDLFLQFCDFYSGTDTNVLDVTTELIRQYQAFYEVIPKGTQTKGKSIADLTNLDGARKAAKTINDHYTGVSVFLQWIRTRGYGLNDLILEVLCKGSKTCRSKRGSKKRHPLSDNEVAAIVSADCFTRTGKFKTAAMYWAPFIFAYTGARQAEVLQLERADIVTVEDIPCFKFTAESSPENHDQKALKTAASERLVPIHSALIDLGFLEFVEESSTRLFPDEPRRAGGNFDAFGKRFRTLRDRQGVTPNEGERKDAHSYRHTVRTKLSEARHEGVAETHYDYELIDSITGHATHGQNVGDRVYNHATNIKQKKIAVEKIEYLIDFDSVIPWHKTTFVKPWKQLQKK